MADVRVVVVTGASGFIGSHIVRECLERGFAVHACVRDKDDPKNRFLLELARSVGRGTIRLFSADLLAPGSYDEAASGADAVIHAAAQVDPGVIKDPWKDMVYPSTEGARNILGSVSRSPSVKHYVHTSSVAAVGIKLGGLVSEADWSSQTIKSSPYDFAKTEAEKLVWQETEGRPYTVSCINPTVVWGPCMTKAHAKASPYFFRQALYGNKQPNTVVTAVDVREVATAHVEAMLRPEASGKRFILDNDEPSVAVNEAIQQARDMFPHCLFGDALGPKGWDEESFGAKPASSWTDNSRSKDVLGIRYRPLADTIRDTVGSMVENGFAPARTASKL